MFRRFDTGGQPWDVVFESGSAFRPLTDAFCLETNGSTGGSLKAERRRGNAASREIAREPSCDKHCLAEHWIWVHPFTMKLTLPDAVELKLSPKNAALHLAIGLFVTEEATLGQAAEIAGLTQAAFLKELGRRRIPIHYGPQELAEDLRAVEAFGRR